MWLIIVEGILIPGPRRVHTDYTPIRSTTAAKY